MKKPRVPKMGSRVFVDGHQGVFAVIHVDENRWEADVELTTGTRKIENHIPFNAIHPADEDVNQAAARVIREVTERD
jgi:hypothetical protein